MFFYFTRQTITMPKTYMSTQNDINSKMRAILIYWLVEVHIKFRLVPETLYLCVNIIDRYCGLVQVKRSKLQLVGVTALLIACKYEEIYPPEVRDCVYITDRAYQSNEVLGMEQDIVHKLGFKITVPTAFPFLQRFFTMVKASKLVQHASSYYTERTLQEHDMLKYRPSVICASAVILALNHPQYAMEDGRSLNKKRIFMVSYSPTWCSMYIYFKIFSHIHKFYSPQFCLSTLNLTRNCLLNAPGILRRR